MRVGVLLMMLVVTLGGCLPAYLRDGQPDAAVIYAAGYERPPGAAEALDVALRSSDLGWDFVNAHTLRFLEVRRGSRASLWVDSAASVGRATSADTVVVIRPATLERTPRDRRQPPTSFWVRLQLEVALVDVVSGEVQTSVLGPLLTDVLNLENPENGLPSVQDDEVLGRLAVRSVDALAPYVVEDLRALHRR